MHTKKSLIFRNTFLLNICPLNLVSQITIIDWLPDVNYFLLGNGCPCFKLCPLSKLCFCIFGISIKMLSQWQWIKYHQAIQMYLFSNFLIFFLIIYAADINLIVYCYYKVSEIEASALWKGINISYFNSHGSLSLNPASHSRCCLWTFEIYRIGE